jgi:pyruvate kinase
VVEVTDTDVHCTAATAAVLDGLLTVFHTERSDEGLSNIQNDLPVLTDFDKQAMEVLAR